MQWADAGRGTISQLNLAPVKIYLTIDSTRGEQSMMQSDVELVYSKVPQGGHFYEHFIIQFRKCHP